MLNALFLLSSGGSAIDVDLDLTVFGQIAVFFVLMLVLKPLLFDPMLKLFEEREKRIEGALAEGIRLDKESAEAQSKYEAEMQRARAAAGAIRDQLRNEGTKAENEILSSVRKETATLLDQGRQNLQSARTTAKAALGAEAKALAGQLASRLLGREVS